MIGGAGTKWVRKERRRSAVPLAAGGGGSEAPPAAWSLGPFVRSEPDALGGRRRGCLDGSAGVVRDRDEQRLEPGGGRPPFEVPGRQVP